MRCSLVWFQGVYYLITGLWPLLNIRSFIAVTGQKTDHLPTGLEEDHWLVMTAGVLITSIALAFLTAALTHSRSREIPVLGMSAAMGLTAIDVIYVTRGVIQPIYLLDAAIESVVIIAWGICLTTKIH